jgi:Fe-S-cluster containining protein
MMNDTRPQDILRPLDEDPFQFDCHKEIACFTKCCAKLRLILTPYDIIRMKHCLGCTSDIFLERYTSILFEKQSRFPMVRIEMLDELDRRCPFVSAAGCKVYESRPAACRLYPVARATTTVSSDRKAMEKFFLIKEQHCLGFREKRQWTLEEWLSHEGVREYGRMNEEWIEIVTSRKSLGRKEHHEKKIKMFYMASYNLDVFRRFLFESRFFELFSINQPDRERLDDDIELMKLALKWMKFSIFGENTINVKPDKVRTGIPHVRV